MNQGGANFSEDDGDWQAIPRWVDYLIRFGYCWGNGESSGRRIALVSMPCASQGAGLITLGAMISDLGRNQANDMTAHSDSLFGYARQHLDFCRKCTLTDCDPDIRDCGFVTKSNGIIRSVLRKNHLYIVSEDTDFEGRELVLCEKQKTATKTKSKPAFTVNPEYVINLHVDGQPPAVSSCVEAGLQYSAYQTLIEGAFIHPENLRKSYSGLVLAGRAKGNLDTRTAYESVCFCNESESWTLAELLTIHGWADSNVSRTAFFNTRTEELDRPVTLPRLVVADGDASFLKSVDTFKKSDVIGVIDRSSDRDSLETVGQKFAALKNWYHSDIEFQGRLPAPVPGISVAILKKQ